MSATNGKSTFSLVMTSITTGLAVLAAVWAFYNRDLSNLRAEFESRMAVLERESSRAAGLETRLITVENRSVRSEADRDEIRSDISALKDITSQHKSDMSHNEAVLSMVEVQHKALSDYLNMSVAGIYRVFGPVFTKVMGTEMQQEPFFFPSIATPKVVVPK